MSITTLVLQDKPQGCILSNFYKLLRALSLPRMLVEFFLKLVYSTIIGKFFTFMIFTFLENALNQKIFTQVPLLSQNFPPSSYHHPQAEWNYSFPPASVFSKICFPNSRKGCRNQWFALLKFNQEIWRWLGTLGYLYFAWPIIFQMWWLCSFLNNLSII